MFATALYMADDPGNITSLPVAIWMCTVTVTTVGYGALPGAIAYFRAASTVRQESINSARHF